MSAWTQVTVCIRVKVAYPVMEPFELGPTWGGYTFESELDDAVKESEKWGVPAGSEGSLQHRVIYSHDSDQAIINIWG